MTRSRRWFLLSVLLVQVLLTATASPAVGQRFGQTESQRRIEERKYDFKEADKEMEYSLFVPTTYDKGKKSPLIVALHGLNSNPRQIMRYRGLTDLAEKHGYIVVAPMGYNERGGYGGWNRPRRGDPENLSELSEKDVLNVLELTRKEFNVDEDRIYILGHSMGGGGAWHLGTKYPDLWAALAPIAPAPGRGGPGALEKAKHIPVIVVQGDQDNLVRPEMTRRWVAKMKELEMEHAYIEVEGGDHVRIAFDKMPDIFEFFNKHKRKATVPATPAEEADPKDVANPGEGP